MSFTWRKIDYFLVLMLALSMAFYVSFAFLPNALDLNSYLGFIEKKMEDKLGRDVSIGGIRLDLARGLGIRIEGFSTGEDGVDHSTVKVDELYVRIRLLPLLRKEVDVDRVDLIRPRIKLQIAKDKDEDPLQALLRKIRRSGGETDDRGGFSITSFNTFYMREGFIRLSDVNDPLSYPPYEVSGLYLLYRNFPLSGPPSLRLKGSVRQGPGRMMVSLAGEFKAPPEGGTAPRAGLDGHLILKGFSVDSYWKYLKSRVPFRDFAGNMDIETDFSIRSDGSFSTRGGTIRFTDLLIDYPRAFKEPFASIKGMVAWDMEYDGRDLTFPALSVDLGDMNLAGTLRIGHVRNREERTILADFAINEFILREGRKYFPTGLIPERITRFIDKRMDRGSLAIDRIRIAGRVQDFHHLSDPSNSGLIYAEANGRGMVARVSDEAILEGVAFRASLKDGDVRFEITEGRFGGNVVNSASGVIRRIYARPVLEVKSNVGLLLPETMAAFSRYIPSDSPYSFLKRVDLAEGTALAQVKWRRPLSGGGGGNTLSGELQLSGCSFRYHGLPLPVEGLAGRVSFSRSSIVATEMKGYVGSSRVTVVDFIRNLDGSKPTFKGNIQWEGNYEDMVSLFPPAQIEGLRVVGSPKVAVDVEGGGDDLSVKAYLELTDVQYSWGDHLRKDFGKPNTLFISAESDGEGGIHFNQLAYTVGRSTATLRGDFKGGEEPYLDMMIAVPNVDFQEVRDLLPGNSPYYPIYGRFRGGGRLSGPLHGSKADLVKLNMTVEDLFFSEFLLNRPFVLRKGGFSYREGSVSIEPTVVELGNSTFCVTGAAKDLSSPKVELSIYGDEISLKDIFRKGFGTYAGAAGGDFLRRVDLSADVSFRSFDLGKISLDNFRTSLHSARDGELEVQDIRFDLSDGRFEGDMAKIGDLDHGSTYEVSNGKIDGIDVNKLMRRFKPSTDLLTGSLSVNVDWLKFSKNGSGSIKDSLDGSFRVKVTDGAINRFKALSALFSLLNLQPMVADGNGTQPAEGLIYKSIEGDFKIKDGVVATENLKIESNAMKIRAVGKINLTKNRFEAADSFKDKNPDLNGMLVIVQPLYLMDSLFSNLPVFQFIAGEKKSLISAFFEVSGKVDDPEVKSIQLTSLRAGIVNRIEEFFKNPINLLFDFN